MLGITRMLLWRKGETESNFKGAKMARENELFTKTDGKNYNFRALDCLQESLHQFTMNHTALLVLTLNH
jgi:hypothetical protein